MSDKDDKPHKGHENVEIDIWEGAKDGVIKNKKVNRHNVVVNKLCMHVVYTQTVFTY